MYNKKIIFLIFLALLIQSCNTFDSVKRGLTGAKDKSSDEFLVKKKDPLTLPPQFESLPTPEDSGVVEEEVSSFERSLTKTTSTENTSTDSSSAEQSILEKIKNK